MKNMYDTIVMAILNIKTPKEEEKMKFYSSLLSIENWFIDLDTFERKMQEMYLLKTNIIKRVCYELGLTYKQLGEAIGYSESTLNNAARQEKISEPLKRAVELYLENLKLKQELADFKTLKAILAR